MPALRSRQRRGTTKVWSVVAGLTLLMSLGAPARAQDPLLEETVGFTGGAGWLGTGGDQCSAEMCLRGHAASGETMYDGPAVIWSTLRLVDDLRTSEPVENGF
jgi:hypothetical protein